MTDQFWADEVRYAIRDRDRDLALWAWADWREERGLQPSRGLRPCADFYPATDGGDVWFWYPVTPGDPQGTSRRCCLDAAIFAALKKRASRRFANYPGQPTTCRQYGRFVDAMLDLAGAMEEVTTCPS